MWLLKQNKTTNCSSTPPVVQWSPRRNHGGLFFKGYLWILGGRAREFVTLSYEDSIGGILGPRVQDIPDTLTNLAQAFTTQREASIYKNDVWRSADGSNWELVTPGCKVQQLSLIADGNKREGKSGRKSEACKRDSDCYGAERCEKHTCVCPMWSPREQHAVASYKNFMYISGGFSSRLYSKFSNCGPYACGDIDATSYRYYLSDVWQSSDGMVWRLITETAFSVKGDVIFSMPAGRGGHQMVVIEDTEKVPYLWVLGGQGGDNTVNGGPEVYYNDIWTAPLSGDNPSDWTPLKIQGSYQMSWANRTGHRVAFEEGTAKNQFVRTLYLYGGYSNQDNGTYYDDLWAYRVDNPDEFWRQDFTPDAYFSTGSRESFQYKNNSPAIHYVSPDSDLEYLQRFWVPTNPTSGSGNRYEIRPYLTTDVLRQMNSVGLKTIRDLAGADVYTVLKLRGFDYPNVPDDQRLTVYDICDFRALAIAVVDKCSVTIPSLYDGERNMPWNIKPVFGGAPPKTNNVKWHGRKNYDFLIPQGDDATVLTEQWDGCQFVPQIEGLFGPNINGLGNVQQVQSIRDPHPEIQNLFCRQTPGPRAYHGLVMFEEMLYLLGGQKNTTYFHADAWYRDARLPQTTILKGPVSHTPQPYFFLSSDKPGSYFEYRVWDPYNFVEVRGWTAIVKKGSVSWMNWRKGGPGTGRYQIYFRAVDPAGNRDEKFVMGKNVYNWYYVSPTPWDIIFGVIGAFIGLCIVAYFEYRRRVKKAAMERYAMKRMRRKFKAMQRDIDGKAVDWRTLYMESKQAEEAGMKGKKKNIKKSKDKNAEKREKEKRKR
jgi:hypothetical protein